MGFFYGKCLAAKVKVLKKGQKTVFGPKLPPAKIFLVQKRVIRDLLICTLKIRYKWPSYHFSKAFICDLALFETMLLFWPPVRTHKWKFWNYFFKVSQIDFSTIGNQSLIDYCRLRSSRQKLKSQKRGFWP